MIDPFNSTSRYLGNLHTIVNILFEQMVNRTHPIEFQLNKVSDTEAAFLNLSISNDTVSTKVYMITGMTLISILLISS